MCIRDRRGIELTVDGTVTENNGLLTLAGNATRPELVLAPLQGPDKVQWDINTRENWSMTPAEETAYERLSAKPVSYTHLDVYKRQDMGRGPEDQRAQGPKRGRVGNVVSLSAGEEAGDDLRGKTIQPQVHQAESKSNPGG